MSNDRKDPTGLGDGQQGAGGLDSGRTPGPHGAQPHFGSAVDRSAQSAPGGSSETEGASGASVTEAGAHDDLNPVDRAGGAGASSHPDRLDAIELADDRTEALNPHRGASASEPSGDLADALAGPASDADYIDEANRETPTLGPIEDDTDKL